MKKTLAGVIVSLLFAGSAFAQQIGSVSSVEGEVLVVRGEQTYTLSSGDAIFDGDRVITQNNGTVAIDAYDCSIALPVQASILVDPTFCTKEPVLLGAGTETIIGTGGEVGAAPFVLGAGLLGALGLAATDDDSPTSP